MIQVETMTAKRLYLAQRKTARSGVTSTNSGPDGHLVVAKEPLMLNLTIPTNTVKFHIDGFRLEAA